ncbi:hypothetical protein [Peptostreptococcus russellii]|nr:hypothetical protein [Peptostreptococcus russellii]
MSINRNDLEDEDSKKEGILKSVLYRLEMPFTISIFLFQKRF